MTNCEMAQVGIEKLIEVLRKWTDQPDIDSNIEIRKLLVSIIRCAQYYGKYLDGFDPKGKPLIDIDRITYTENKEDLSLTDEEKQKDELTKKQELEFLSSLGTKQNLVKFNDAVALIWKQAIEDT